MMDFKQNLKSTGNAISNIPGNFMKLDSGKKLYVSIWFACGIALVTFIGVVATWTKVGGPSATDKQIITIAAIAFVFLVLLTAAIFATVIVSIRLKKRGGTK